MKVFDRPFFKKGRRDLGQRPKSRPQARNLSNAVSIRAANYWFIFLRLLRQKRTERIFSMLRVLIHSILFFDTAGAKKRIKRNAENISRLRARPRAARPWMGGRFLKKATQKLSSCESGPFW